MMLRFIIGVCLSALPGGAVPTPRHADGARFLAPGFSIVATSLQRERNSVFGDQASCSFTLSVSRSANEQLLKVDVMGKPNDSFDVAECSATGCDQHGFCAETCIANGWGAGLNAIKNQRGEIVAYANCCGETNKVIETSSCEQLGKHPFTLENFERSHLHPRWHGPRPHLSTLQQLPLVAEPLPTDAVVVDLKLIDSDYCGEGYQKVDKANTLNGDLNEGTEGTDLYLCVKYGRPTDGDAITDLYLVEDHYGTADHAGDEEARCPVGYTAIKHEDDVDGDFNEGLEAKYIYLCIQRGGPHQPIAALKIVDHDCDPGMYGVPHSLNLTGDLNQEAGDIYIYLCFRRAVAPRSCTAKDVSGKWMGRGTLLGRESEIWKYGIHAAHQESNTDEWRQSVTSLVKENWTLFGMSGFASISGSLAHQTSEAWSDAWEEGEYSTISLVHELQDKGKHAWEFVFTFSDSCGHTEHASLKEMAITSGAWQEPCCIPGFAIDAPYYTTCHSRDAMVPGVEHCKVLGKSSDEVPAEDVISTSLPAAVPRKMNDEKHREEASSPLLPVAV